MNLVNYNFKLVLVWFFVFFLHFTCYADTTEITLLFTGELNGYFANIDCENRSDLTEYRLARIQTIITAMKEESIINGKPAPIIVDYGDLVSPYVFSRFLLETEHGIDQLVDLIQEIDYDLVCPGNREFDEPPEIVDILFNSYYQNGIMILASNLQPETEEIAVYQTINKIPESETKQNYIVIERNDIRIGFITLLPEDLKKRIAGDRLTGIKVQDPKETLSEILNKIKDENVDAIAVIAHVETGQTSPRNVIDLVEQFSDIDFIICNEFGNSEQPGRSIRSVTFADKKTIVTGIPPEGKAVGKIILTFDSTDGVNILTEMKTQTLFVSDYQPDERMKSRLQNIESDYCSVWKKPLGTGKIKEEMSADDYLDYLLAIARSIAKTDIAMINVKGIYRAPIFPLKENMTLDTLYQTMPFDNKLYKFTMTGKDLQALATKYQDILNEGQDDVLRFLGYEDGKVNGRTLDVTDVYSIVTTEFMIKGGDGVLDPENIATSLVTCPSTGKELIVRDMVRLFFEEDRFQSKENETLIDINTNFPDLWKKTLWKINANIKAEHADNSKNDEVEQYSHVSQPQLSTSDLRYQTLAIDLALTADSKNFNWENILKTGYTKSKTDDEPETESEDIIYFESTYKLRYFKNKTFEEEQWRPFFPVPYLSVSLESEFTEGNPGTETDREALYRHMELKGTAGLRFELLSTLDLKLGVGYQKELDLEDADTQTVLEIGYELKKTTIFFLPDLPIYIESRLDYLHQEANDIKSTEIYWQNRLLFAFFKNLSFYFGFNRFYYRDNEIDRWAIANEMKVGLDILFIFRKQSF